MRFTYSELRNFLSHCKSLGLVIPFVDYNEENAILLRHDIDFDVDMAYKVAQIEVDVGVRSTFFFMTTCDAYNILSASNRKKIKEMSDLGFEIGLHFDPTLYDSEDISELEKHAKRESEIIFDVTGREVKSLSLHNPSLHGMYPVFPSFINAYDLSFFDDAKYLSDSRLLFSGKNPYEFVRQVKDSVVQVLLHPIHYNEEDLGYPDILAKYILRKIDSLDALINVNSTYAEQIGDSSLKQHILKMEK